MRLAEWMSFANVSAPQLEERITVAHGRKVVSADSIYKYMDGRQTPRPDAARAIAACTDGCVTVAALVTPLDCEVDPGPSAEACARGSPRPPQTPRGAKASGSTISGSRSGSPGSVSPHGSRQPHDQDQRD